MLRLFLSGIGILLVLAFGLRLSEHLFGRFQGEPVAPVAVAPIDNQKAIEIDPINGFEQDFDVHFRNTSSTSLMIAGCVCDWCVVEARLPDGMTTLHPGESKKLNVSLRRLPTVDDSERNAMVQDAVSGKPITKVPDQIKIDFYVLPNDEPVSVGVTVLARPSASYIAICESEFPHDSRSPDLPIAN